MKKLLPFFGALALVLTSCSSDDSNDASASIKPSRITYLDGDSETSYFIDYKYDGNKIVSETEDDGSTTKYTYTGDLITKKEDFGSDNQVDYTTEYTYTNGKVSSQIMKYSEIPGKNSSLSYYDKLKYTYNSDNTVSYEGFYVSASAGTEEKNGSYGTLTFQDGNLIKSVTTVNYGSTATYFYEYDTKNSPFKNVTGGSLLIDKGFEVSAHNITKYSGSSVSVDKKIGLSSHAAKSAASTSNPYINTFTYTYDSNDFPTEGKSFDSDGALRETVKYTY
ncbi:hypothetical protein AR687_09325 [Flavobacteriaceae bacterium CRH]|nr:hypothetical protein AR687_09325 [Flavobacteriaceae bacterium CRH]